MKKLIGVVVPSCIGAVVFSVMVLQASAASAPSPLAEWTFNEGSGTIVHDTAGNNAGTLVNSPSWVPGKLGEALDFTGNSMVQISSAPSINNLSSFTVVAWINARQGGRIITKGDTRPVRFYVALAPKGSGSVDFGAGYDGTSGDWHTANGAVSSNVWHQVAVTYAFGQQPTIYVDGVAQGGIVEGSLPTGNIEPDNTSLYIGNRGDNVATFDGQIDDVQLYGQVLSASAIQSIYQAAQTPATPAPTVTLTQSSATTTADGGTKQAFSISWSSTNASSCVVQKTNPAGQLFNPWATGTSGTLGASSPAVGVHHWWIDCTGAGGTGHADLYHTVLSNTVPVSQPNIVVIMDDDQDNQGSINVMTQVQSLLTSQGISFTNSFVVNPLCCSSRASFLTGQYSHNDGVWQNAQNTNGFNGGYGALAPTDGNTLPVWMQKAGYNTALIGKYLNQYGIDVPQTYVPPGWSTWDGLVDPTTYSYYNYTINNNGTLEKYGSTTADYQTDVLTNKAVNFINLSAASSQPFFLWLTPLAPHAGDEFGDNVPTPSPKYAGTFANLPLLEGPSFNEVDMSDKPSFMQNLPVMDGALVALTTESYRTRRETLLSVDDMVAQVVAALSKAGKLNNTYIIFTSDNGYFQGQHRLAIEKRLGYEEAIEVPLIIKGPGVPAGQTNSSLVANIDLPATILDIAHATAGRAEDGRSLLPYLSASGASNPIRADLLIEGTDKIPFDTTFYSSYAGVRTTRFVYIEHKTLAGAVEKELYDLTRDPYELQNQQGNAAYATIMQKLANELASLRFCQGAACWFATSSITPSDLASLPKTPIASDIGSISVSSAAVPTEPGELEETNLSVAQKAQFYAADGNSAPPHPASTGTAQASIPGATSVPSGTSDPVSQQIADLQAQLQKLQALIAQLTATTTSTTQEGGTSASTSQTDFGDSACPNLPSGLSRGITGTAVTALQTFFNKTYSNYTNDYITGYFGQTTETAVQQWQSEHGIVSSGTPQTTGYGAVGPQTRATIAASCK